ncbi:MAG TPA: maleylpyruvate isomerase [Acidimicrobiaceae bacterium]|nr:maleylpyruvate isomerase [Acidimicrobiaceae bacterium]
MNDLQRDIAGAIDAHHRLEADLSQWEALEVGEPSLLDGWTRGHVLTHLARNADSHAQMLAAAARGEPAVQYPGGRAQRDADIEAGAGRPLAELIADVMESNRALEAAWSAAGERVWSATGDTVAGPVALSDLPFRRWRETTVHHADLGGAFTWRDWPADYVRLELQRMTMLWNSRQSMGLTGLPAAALAVPPEHRLAWLMGRASIDGLAPAELMA